MSISMPNLRALRNGNFGKNILRLSAIAVLALLAACDETSQVRSQSAKRNASNLSASMVKSRITAAEIDGAPMRLNKFHVSLFEFSRFKYPIISYEMPDKADYAQIIRCRADAKLGDLGNIEIGATNTKEADEKYKTYDYWKTISTTFGCVVVATSVSVDKFIDFFASDGSWVYVGRACVQASRLPADSSEATLSPCSRQVSKTMELPSYKNVEKAISAEKKQQLMTQRDKIDSLGRNIVYKAKALDNEINRCESERGSNRASQKRREAIGKLLGIGVGLGSKLIADQATRSIIGGLDVGGIFKDLSAQAGDFLPADFCPNADLLAKELEIDKQQLEVESEDYKQSLKLFGDSQ
jgi:hypothetical protein